MDSYSNSSRRAVGNYLRPLRLQLLVAWMSRAGVHTALTVDSTRTSPPLMQSRCLSGDAEPPRHRTDQILLILAGPRDVTVGPQQHRWSAEFFADVDDVVDAIRPTR